MKRINAILAYLLISITANAQTWNTVGGGVTSGSSVDAFEVYNSELYAEGYFTQMDGMKSYRIARWNGINWDSVGGGVDGIWGADMEIYNGELYVVGVAQAGGINVNEIARWDGTKWDSVDGGVSGGINPQAYALAVYKNQLYVGGNITKAGGINISGIARWDGTKWDSVGGGISGGLSRIDNMIVYQDTLYVIGYFNKAGNINAKNIARWNGINWDSVGSGINITGGQPCLGIYNNELYAGGSFTVAGGVPVNNIARWNSVKWDSVGGGVNGDVESLIEYNNELYVGGLFDTAGGIIANNITKWNGVKWDSLGSGTNPGFSGYIFGMSVYNNELYVGGSFDTAGTIVAHKIARWHMQGAGIDEQFSTNNSQCTIFPNPLHNGEADIKFALPSEANVSFSLRNLLGQELKAIPQKKYHAGEYAVHLNLQGMNAGQGVYYLEMRTDSQKQYQKIIIIK